MSANIKKEFSSTVAKKAATSRKVQIIKQAIVKRAKHTARIGSRNKKRYVLPALSSANMGIVKKPINLDLQERKSPLVVAIENQETVNPTEMEESSNTSSDDTLSADEAKEATQNEAPQEKIFYKPPVIPLKSCSKTPVKGRRKKPIKKPVRDRNIFASILKSIANRPTVSHPGLVPNRIQAQSQRRLATTIASVTRSSVSNVNLPGLPDNQYVLVPLNDFFQMLPSTQNKPQFSTGTQLQMATGRHSVLQTSVRPPALRPRTVSYLRPSGQLTNYGRADIGMSPFVAGPNQQVQTIVVRGTNPGQMTPLSSFATPSVITATSSGPILTPQAANKEKKPARFRKVLMDQAEVKRLEAVIAREQRILESGKKLPDEQSAVGQKHSGDLTISSVDDSAARVSRKEKNSLEITASQNHPSPSQGRRIAKAVKSFKSSFTSSKIRPPSISTLPLKTPEKLLKPTFRSFIASQKPMQSTTKPTGTVLAQKAIKPPTAQSASSLEFYIKHQTADGQQKTFKFTKLPPNHPSITAFKNKIPQPKVGENRPVVLPKPTEVMEKVLPNEKNLGVTGVS